MTDEEPCDACRFTEYPCPGEEAHCKAGFHCISVVEVCCLDFGQDDHSLVCCTCKQSVVQR